MTRAPLLALAVLVTTPALAKPPPPAVLAKLQKNDVKPFAAKVKQLCGPTVKATVKLEAPPDADTRPYAVKDVGGFLSRAANSGDLTRNSLNMVAEGLKAVTSDSYGKQAVTQGLKEVVVYAAVGDGFITFENGVLTVASHIFGDGEGTSIPADLVEKTLVWGLDIDEPHVGHRVALQHRRAIETIEVKEIAPFKVKVKAFAPKATVTVRDPPAEADGRAYAVKDPGPYLVRAGLTEHQLTLFTLNLIVEAFTEVASDDVGKAALASELKEVVVLTTVGEGVLSVKDGVLTVGSHVFGDGLGSSIPSSAMEQALRDGLFVSDAESGTKVSLGHLQARQRIEAKHIAPFRKSVAELLGPSVTVTAKYSPPPKDEQPVKDAAKYLAQVAGSTNFSINGLDLVVAALKAQEAGRKQVKSIVVYVLVGDSFATLSDGVLSVGGHAVMDGLGSSLREEQVAKALGAKR